MVSAKTLLSYMDYKIPFAVQIDASDKQFGANIIQNNKPIPFFSIRSSEQKLNYNTT